MKLLIVAPHFPPAHVGGVEVIARGHAEWMQQAGHQVGVVCVEHLGDSANVSAVVDRTHGYEVHRLTLGVGSGDFRLLHAHDGLRAWFEALLHDARPDVMHVHSGYLTGAPALAAAKSAAVRTVLTLHDYWFICPRITLLQPDGSCCDGPEPSKCAWCLRTEQRRFRWADQATAGVAGSVGRNLTRASLFDRAFVNALLQRNDCLRSLLMGTDVVLSPSVFLRSLMADAGFPEDHIRTHVTGIEPQPRWERRRDADGPLSIGYAGRIVEPKGVHLLIEAARALPFENWTLAIHGPTTVDARYMLRLESLAAGDPRIQFKGPFAGDQQSRVFSELDVLVVPSLWYENRPLIILEAQSAGLPIVAARLGGMAELVDHGRSGLLFQPGDVRDLAAQLTALRNDPSFADRLAAVRSSVMTVDQEMASLQRIYAELTS